MYLINNGCPLSLLVEASAYDGVYKIAEKVSADIEKVCSIKPTIFRSIEECAQKSEKNIVLFATLGKSEIINQLISLGKIDPAPIEKKWECYFRTIVYNPFPGIDSMVIVCGSDKRGTIYGMFSLSEYIGVSALCFWGDVEPIKKENIVLGADWNMNSQEPSVKYRGFFINDEWPCFGRWTKEKFGGINAKAYDIIFEFLLRMKGNYLWPAMWRSNFPLDGPDSANEELSELYGVVMGFSHHEPCLRSGAEYGKVRGEGSIYGDAWNFHTNREGIIRFWRDGLLRSGKYENLITIGMRGEDDTTILGEDATLKDNIDLLKEVITVQKQLIKECVPEDKAQKQQLLAIYKEVEPFFYGDENVPGLKDWDGLENVICMLCEDNYGFLRSLPTTQLREQITKRGGGFGMYYHLDYHGAPVSYEWLSSTPLPKIWEQMCMAYDYGIQDVWIVNVGDIKGYEFELEYFLTLAYDYETWGSKKPNSWKTYLQSKLLTMFPENSEELRADMAKSYIECMKIAGLRRPEAVNADVFHPCHYLEADKVLSMIQECENLGDLVFTRLEKTGEKRATDAYYSVFYHNLKAITNLYKMWIYSGKNHHYAKQGRTIANYYGDLVKECLKKDRVIGEEFSTFKNGKWNGMELEAHIGFRAWNEDGCTYPVCQEVLPYAEPRLSLSRKDQEKTVIRAFGGPRQILVEDFTYPEFEDVIIELANTGVGYVDFEILGNAPWLEISKTAGSFNLTEDITLTFHPERMENGLEKDQVVLKVVATRPAFITEGKADPEIVVVAKKPTKSASRMAREKDGVIAINVADYVKTSESNDVAFVMLDHHGRSGVGMKVQPNTASFDIDEQAPFLKYSFEALTEGEYEAEFWLTPTSPVKYKGSQKFALSINGSGKKEISVLPDSYRAGDWKEPTWSKGVLDHIRKISTTITCREGENELVFHAMDAGVVLERIFIYKKSKMPKESYLRLI